MDAAQLKRVHFLVRRDAWDAWENLGLEPDTLNQAFEEYGDLRLVAAYVLETVCADAKVRAVQASQDAQAIKGVKVGAIEVQMTPGTAGQVDLTTAQDWCARAQALRDTVDAEQYRAQQRRSGSVDLEVTF